MSTTGTEAAPGSVARRIVADALRLNWAGLEPAFAVRCAAGVAIPLVLSAVAGQPLAGASAAYGALVAGIASRQGVNRTRVAVMLTASAAVAVSGLAGALTGPFPVLNIALLAVWTLAFGVVSSLGRSATVVAVNACVGYVLFSNPPYDTANPGFHALMLFAGGTLQTLLLVLVWPLSQFRAERSALATAYTTLARYATGLRVDDLGLPDSQTFAVVGAALADPQPFASRAEIAAYQLLADEAERLRATLAALGTDGHLLNEVGRGDLARAVSDAGHAAGPLLEEVAAAVMAGREPLPRAAERRALDDALREIERRSSGAATYTDDARALAGQVRAALRSVGAAANGGRAFDAAAAQPMARRNLVNVRAMAEQVWVNCSWSSSYARHAVRLTVTLTVAVILQHVLSLAHAQWIGLTVVLVLRPDFASTFSRGVARVAGTVAGAILASLLAALHPSGSFYLVLAIVFSTISFALFSVSYALYSIAITGYIVYLLAFGGAAEHASALDRVVATVIGGLLALIAYAAWPAWTHTRVADELADLVDAQRRYLERVLLGFADGGVDEASLRAAQAAAWRARSNAEASVDQMAAEPVRPRGIGVRDAAGMLAETRRLGIAGLTLHARVRRIAGATHELIEGFAGDLDVALRAVVEALRSGLPAAPLPPLRADHSALRRALDDGDPAVEVLVSESDLIVDAIDNMAAITVRRATTQQAPVGRG